MNTTCAETGNPCTTLPCRSCTNLARHSTTAPIALHATAGISSVDPTAAAFEAGRQACAEGLDLDANPHSLYSLDRRAWYDGWCMQNLQQWIARYGT